MSNSRRCEYCHDVIGVYEPMVVLEAGELRSTSRTAEQDDALEGDCYHAACSERVHGEAAAKLAADALR